MRTVFSQQPEPVSAALKATEYLPPPYARIGTPPLVSGKWIPSKPVLLTAISITVTAITGSCRFALITGDMDAVMPTQPELIDLFLMGGSLQQWITTTSIHTRQQINLLVNPDSWLVIAEFDENPCSSPVVMFEGEVQY